MTVLGTPVDAKLPEPVDAVLMVDAYAEFEQPVALLRNVARSLKPKGTLGIVNYKKDGGGPGPPMEERVDAEKVIADARAAGLELRKREILPALSVPADFRRRAEMSAVPSFFADYQRPVTAELQSLVPDAGEPVERAMAYTVLAPSKQVRAVLVLLCAELCGGQAPRAVPAAAAIELVHAASLILDDLPSMDDAPLRRGRRANHLEFGEAVAILAAFGLLNLAYGALARGYEPAAAARMSSLLSDAVGPSGLIGGQALDLQATDQQISFETLERIHRGKTGALFVAAATCGARHRRRRGGADRGAVRVREEPRPGISDRGRPARRRGGSGAHRQSGPRRRAQDDVRVVQRRRRARASSRRSSARPRIARSRRSARRADRLRELSAFVPKQL